MFRGVSFELRPWDDGRLVGENGSGKSVLMRIVVGGLKQEQHTRQASGSNEKWNGMALAMMAMCVGMVLVISIASAVGGPIAWVLAVAAIVGLAVGHMKLMNHGGH